MTKRGFWDNLFLARWKAVYLTTPVAVARSTSGSTSAMVAVQLMVPVTAGIWSGKLSLVVPLPPWHMVYQQAQGWLKTGMLEDMVHDLRILMREIEDRMQQPRSAILDSRTQQSTPESGGRAGWDGRKRRQGTKVHLAVDTLGQLLALLVTPANEQDRAQVGELARQIQEVTGDSVEIAYVDQGYTGDKPAAAAEAHGIRPEVVKLPTVKRGFVLLPRRWVIERSLGRIARFRRLVRDHERSRRSWQDPVS